MPASLTLCRSAIVLSGLLTIGASAGAPPISVAEEFTICSGHEGGNYYRVAREISSALGQDETFIIRTNGSYENVERIAAGDCQLGLVQSDVMLAIGYRHDLGALARLYRETIHILFVPRAGERTLHDVARRADGLRVDIGLEKSGTSGVAKLVLAFSLPEVVPKTFKTSPKDSLDRLLADKTDVVFIASAIPHPQLKGAGYHAYSSVRLLPLEAPILRAWSESQVLEPFTVEGKKYSWHERDTKTLAVSALLVAKRDGTWSERRVAKVLDAVYKMAGRNADAELAFLQDFNARDARTGGLLPMMSDAERYHREKINTMYAVLPYLKAVLRSLILGAVFYVAVLRLRV